LNSFTTDIFQKINDRIGQIAILIDPDKTFEYDAIQSLVEKATWAKVDYFFVGGSTVTRERFAHTIETLKKLTKIPVLIFPGGNHQISSEADALLYLSLVSGRNPDYLISHHVNSALEVLNLNIEVIPTGYILIDGGTQSSVAYVSQTTPIPRNQEKIALNTAVAAMLQGKKMIFFDAGSGANYAVPNKFVSELKKTINCPILVGGGIKTLEEIESFAKAGTNVIVVGNKIEEDLDFLIDIQLFKKDWK
jgi:putative glycerol-1-phosphate prenyltransferase